MRLSRAKGSAFVNRVTVGGGSNWTCAVFLAGACQREVVVEDIHGRETTSVRTYHGTLLLAQGCSGCSTLSKLVSREW